MKTIASIVCALALGTTGSIALAQEDGAGCGLGAVVLEGKSGKGANIAAGILNGLIPNTFFMTTGGGIMGCDPTQTVQKEHTEVFVAANMDRLSSEIARGQGDYLDALTALMGVEEQHSASFHALTQAHYDELFNADGDAGSVIDALQLAMREDANLARYAKL